MQDRKVQLALQSCSRVGSLYWPSTFKCFMPASFHLGDSFTTVRLHVGMASKMRRREFIIIIWSFGWKRVWLGKGCRVHPKVRGEKGGTWSFDEIGRVRLKDHEADETSPNAFLARPDDHKVVEEATFCVRGRLGSALLRSYISRD